jgi:glucokinase
VLCLGQALVSAWPALFRGSGTPRVLPSEGGHATFAGSNEREDAIIQHLRGMFGHVSAERVVSGDGLENIYNAIVALDALKSPPQCAAAITESALKGDCAATVEALATFCGFLGSFAGNTVLTFGAAEARISPAVFRRGSWTLS